MTEHTFEAAMTNLANNTSRKVSIHQNERYWRRLNDIPDRIFNDTVTEWMDNNLRFPTVGDLRELADKRLARRADPTEGQPTDERGRIRDPDARDAKFMLKVLPMLSKFTNRQVGKEKMLIFAKAAAQEAGVDDRINWGYFRELGWDMPWDRPPPELDLPSGPRETV